MAATTISGAGPPGVRRTSTKFSGLRMRARSAAAYSMRWPRPSGRGREERRRLGVGEVARTTDDVGHDLVCLAKRQSVIAHEDVGKLGHRDPGRAGALAHPGDVELRLRQSSPPAVTRRGSRP